VCCSVLQCVAVCCSVSQCVAVCCSVMQCVCVAVCCSVLQCVAVCCSVLQCVAECCSESQCYMNVSYCSSRQHTSTRKTLQYEISLATRYFSSYPPCLFPIQPIHSADLCDFLNLLLKFLHNITMVLILENISPAARCFSSCQPPRLIQRARALRISTGAAMATHKWAALTCHSAPDLTIRGLKWACSIFQSTPTKLLYTP